MTLTPFTWKWPCTMPCRACGRVLVNPARRTTLSKPAFAQRQQLLARVALLARDAVVVPPQLPFAEAVVVLDLLLLRQRRSVVRRPLRPGVHPRRSLATFQGASGAGVLVDQRYPNGDSLSPSDQCDVPCSDFSFQTWIKYRLSSTFALGASHAGDFPSRATRRGARAKS